MNTGRVVRLVLDASAIGEYGRTHHVGETIASLGEEEEPAGFGVPVLALASAWAQAADKHARDLILNMLNHPWCVRLPVTAEQALRPDPDGDLGSPLRQWSSELGSDELAHTVVCALDHTCQILTAIPEAYRLPGLTITIPGDDEDWPDEADYWPT